MVEDRFVSIGEGGRHGPRDSTTKRHPDDEPRNEYDFRQGVRGRHYRKMTEEGTVVRLDPDVAAEFPTSKAVNDALRDRRPADAE